MNGRKTSVNDDYQSERIAFRSTVPTSHSSISGFAAHAAAHRITLLHGLIAVLLLTLIIVAV